MNHTQSLLKSFDDLPDLLAIAREEVSSIELYVRQNQLRLAYQERCQPYKWSMPMRELLQCPICGMQQTHIRYELGDGLHTVKLRGAELHQVRVHGGSFPSEVETFLRTVQ